VGAGAVFPGFAVRQGGALNFPLRGWRYFGAGGFSAGLAVVFFFGAFGVRFNPGMVLLLSRRL
jgi:hypothetical protein